MRMTVLRLLPLVLILGVIFVSSLTPRPAPLEAQDAAVPIDFNALHVQANAALEHLLLSQERRLASAHNGTLSHAD